MSQVKKFNDAINAMDGIYQMSDKEVIQSLIPVIDGPMPLVFNEKMIERGGRRPSPFFKLSQRIENKTVIERLIKPLKKKGTPLPVFVADKGEHLSNLMWADGGAIAPTSDSDGLTRIELTTLPRNEDYPEDRFLKDRMPWIAFKGENPLSIPRLPFRSALKHVIRKKGGAHFLAHRFAKSNREEFGIAAAYKCGMFLATLDTGKHEKDISTDDIAQSLRQWFSPEDIKTLLHIGEGKSTLDDVLNEQHMLELLESFVSGHGFRKKAFYAELGQKVTEDLLRLEKLESRESRFDKTSRRSSRPAP